MTTSWHIHVDAHKTTPQFEEFVISKLGFWPQDFLHEERVDEHYEPARHLTHHPKDGQEFKKLFGLLKDYLALHPDELEGYIEGEYIPSDVDILQKPFNSSAKLPLRVHLKRLPLGQFRESEIHISLLRDQSDQRLLNCLRAMGLYVAYLPKEEGVGAIFTVQGLRQHIGELLPRLTAYLQEAGGGVGCSIKEERVADWWTSSPKILMPPVVERIEWL